MGNDLYLLTDIRLEVCQKDFRPLYRVAADRRPRPDGQGYIPNFLAVSGRDNLGQAVLMRLLTPRGELSDIGHPEYGSRLHELVGEKNTDTTLNLLRLYILESLQREPRIEKVTDIDIRTTEGRRSSVDVRLAVLPIGKTATVSIGPFTLEFE